MSFQYSSHKHRRRALHMSDKVRSAIWPHEGVGYYPDIAFPYNLFTAPTVCSRAGRQIQGIRIRLGLESRRHASNDAQCIYTLLYSERLRYCLRLELTNVTRCTFQSQWCVRATPAYPLPTSPFGPSKACGCARQRIHYIACGAPCGALCGAEVRHVVLLTGLRCCSF